MIEVLTKTKLNCWEAKKCGCEPGGRNSKELGVCPASTETYADGINNGVNGGRACWVIKQTLCDNNVQGTFSQKLNGCLKCEFYAAVRDEERENFQSSRVILARLN